jgi:hypothetical protein
MCSLDLLPLSFFVHVDTATTTKPLRIAMAVGDTDVHTEEVTDDWMLEEVEEVQVHAQGSWFYPQRRQFLWS